MRLNSTNNFITRHAATRGFKNQLDLGSSLVYNSNVLLYLFYENNNLYNLPIPYSFATSYKL